MYFHNYIDKLILFILGIILKGFLFIFSDEGKAMLLLLCFCYMLSVFSTTFTPTCN